MSDERVWLRHKDTGGYFHCPVGAVEDWQDNGWQPSDPPPTEPSPVVAELLAWQAQRAAAPEPQPKTSRKGGSDNTAQEG